MAERLGHKIRRATESGRNNTYIKEVGGWMDSTDLWLNRLRLTRNYSQQIVGLEKALGREDLSDLDRSNRETHLHNLRTALSNLEAAQSGRTPSQPTLSRRKR